MQLAQDAVTSARVDKSYSKLFWPLKQEFAFYATQDQRGPAAGVCFIGLWAFDRLAWLRARATLSTYLVTPPESSANRWFKATARQGCEAVVYHAKGCGTQLFYTLTMLA